MKRHEQTEVLVVGAGPVGMFTALRLAENGIGVQLIDQEAGTASRSFACALHSRTLQLLNEVGLANEVIQLGNRIDKLAFYDGSRRQAEIDLSQLPLEFPYILVLEQNVLENLLEKKLQERAGLRVLWNHRFSDLAMKAEGVSAAIDELAMSGKGYGVADFDMMVKKTATLGVEFLVGADGPGSVVRQRLGIESERSGTAQMFVVYEFETESKLAQEVSIVLEEDKVCVLWPFGENRGRWSFQWQPADGPADFPPKDRNHLRSTGNFDTDPIRENLRQRLQEHAPWFQSGIKEITWATTIQFEHRRAKQFGRDRAWLVGDAAHQTGPIGVQSMNVGFREGADLTDKLTQILGEMGSHELLATYNREHRREWEQMLDGANGAPAAAGMGEWANAQSARIRECVPASGRELTLLLHQLGCEFAPTETPSL